MTKRKRANITEDFEEHLVPELCEKIEFPAVYWLKASVLPSIVHRIKQLLVALDLRDEIAREAHLKLQPRKSDEKYEPLMIQDNGDHELNESNKETNLDDTALEEEQDAPTDPSEVGALSEVDSK